MVTNGGSTRDGSRNRAQLILIGALALAFIILGVVVVFNGVLYTETISSGPSGQSASEATATEHELERGLAGIAHRVNVNETEGTSESDYEADFGAYLDSYAKAHLETRAKSQPVVTDVGFDTVVREANVVTTTVDSADGIEADEQRIGHLSLELEHTGSGGGVAVDVDGNTLNIDETADGFDLEYGADSCSIEVDDGDTVWIDLVAGEASPQPNGDCPGGDVIDTAETQDLEITVNSGVDGDFELVTHGDDDEYSGVTPDYGAWDIAANVSHLADDVRFDRTHRISVYGDDGQSPLGLTPDKTCADLDTSTGSVTLDGGYITECDIDESGVTVDVDDGSILLGELNLTADLDVTNGAAFYGTVRTTQNIDVDQGRLNGDIVEAQTVTLDNGAEIDGRINASGDVDMGDTVVHEDVVSRGSVDIDTDSTVREDVLSEDGVTIDGDSVVYGDVISENDVTVNGGTVHGTIEENVDDIDDHS